MPMYAYKCRDCGEESEHIQKFSDAPLTECESCGGRIEKQMTAPAFHLKGGGWYADGYASTKGDSGSGKSDSGSSSSDSGSSSSDSGSGSSDSGSSSSKKTESKKGSGSSDAA